MKKFFSIFVNLQFDSQWQGDRRWTAHVVSQCRLNTQQVAQFELDCAKIIIQLSSVYSGLSLSKSEQIRKFV